VKQATLEAAVLRCKPKNQGLAMEAWFPYSDVPFTALVGFSFLSLNNWFNNNFTRPILTAVRLQYSL